MVWTTSQHKEFHYQHYCFHRGRIRDYWIPLVVFGSQRNGRCEYKYGSRDKHWDLLHFFGLLYIADHLWCCQRLAVVPYPGSYLRNRFLPSGEWRSLRIFSRFDFKSCDFAYAKWWLVIVVDHSVYHITLFDRSLHEDRASESVVSIT